MKSFFSAVLVAALCSGAGSALAQTATPPAETQICRVCHGVDGIGTNPMIPNIGGQSPDYLSKQLQDFRAGRREDPQMTIITQDLTDEDIKAVSDWYGSIAATYELPQ